MQQCLQPGSWLLNDKKLAVKLATFKKEMARQVEDKNKKLQRR